MVLDGEATFYDKLGNSKVLQKGEGIMLPENWYYWFQSTGDKPLALLRFTAYKSNRPQVKRIDAQGRTRDEDEVGYAYVDGEPVREQFWELS